MPQGLRVRPPSRRLFQRDTHQVYFMGDPPAVFTGGGHFDQVTELVDVDPLVAKHFAGKVLPLE